MTTADWREQKRRRNRVREDILTAKEFCVLISIKLWPVHRPRCLQCANFKTVNKCYYWSISRLFSLTFHSQPHQDWAWGLSWRCRPLSGWQPVGWCPSGTPVCPSLPSWRWSLLGALWPWERSMDDSLKREKDWEHTTNTQKKRGERKEKKNRKKEYDSLIQSFSELRNSMDELKRTPCQPSGIPWYSITT